MPNKLLKELHLGQNFFRRLNPDYYFNELRLNAIRRKVKGYDENRREEICALHKKRRMINKGCPPKKWSKKEIRFLTKNYKVREYKEIAKMMGRSTGSIEHKVLRLGLRKNNRWIKDEK